jgi:prephenate dehydrogenase
MPKSRVTIVGLGCIGGSIGLGLKKAKLDLEIVGHDKDAGAASRALKRGAVDKTDWNLIGACDGAGLIVLALPLEGIQGTLAALKPHLEPGVIVTDTATTKLPVLEWAKDLPRNVHFVGGHPVLKPERTLTGRGIDAADAALFQGATYCLTPAVTAEPGAIETVANLAHTLGAKPYFVDAAEHDGLAAGVEHLPALLATALAAATMRSQGWRELGNVASLDFNSATALMPQDGQTARAQFLAQRADLARWIDRLTEQLQELRGMVERGDGDALQGLIEDLVQKRAQWLSGRLRESDMPPVDYQAAQLNAARFLLGGLADRAPKRK